MYAGGANSVDNQSHSDEQSSRNEGGDKKRSKTEDKELIQRAKDFKKLIGKFNAAENETFQRGRLNQEDTLKESSPAQGPDLLNDEQNHLVKEKPKLYSPQFVENIYHTIEKEFLTK